MNASQWKLFLGSQQSFIWDVHRAVHQETAVDPEGSSLLRLRVHIDPHLLGRFVSNHNFSLRNLISYEEVLVFNVLGSFATGAPSIYFQEDAALVVLVDESMGHIVTLLLNKVEAPENLLHGVVYTHQLGLGGALSIKLLFPGAANDGPLPEGHACPSLSFAVPVYSMGRIDEPDCE